MLNNSYFFTDGDRRNKCSLRMMISTDCNGFFFFFSMSREEKKESLSPKTEKNVNGLRYPRAREVHLTCEARTGKTVLSNSTYRNFEDCSLMCIYTLHLVTANKYLIEYGRVSIKN